MESKLPVPTDNIFKFYALFSLLLFIFSVGSLLYVQQSINDLVFENLEEVEALRQQEGLTPPQELRKALLERKLEVATSNRGFFNKALGVLIGLAICGMFYGFRKWHTDVQPVVDETSRIQLQIAKLQLEKLQADVAKMSQGVGTP
ncbi:hypothetical protein FBY03_12521 [Pseudomonas sp. SJZ079]|uniref:hypothetical protein n=1 Tax=Pseudomonas sp. SJZ079 TaxID=2572887 RepID=UPI00119962E9|nr:hypothetical protein [Pseudomonas sp. SJZ079]TWC30198.1 hypothetical protein FBY03_12521 [Pseudomonas sp. SJZ079]